jgi:hypothetical protein
MSSWLFYAVSAAENLLIFGADVSNAFAEAPPPKQGFYIHPDRAFRDWWVNHKLSLDPTWMKKFNAAIGDPDQKRLAKAMEISYRSGVGELIWAMTTCCPNLAYAGVKLSQANLCPHEHHFHGVKHALKYLYSTKEDGLYFWLTAPRNEFNEGPLPPIYSNEQDLLLDNWPEYDAHVLHAYADSDWASCVKTRRLFGGTCIRLAGGTIAYKTKFQRTVAGSSTEAEFMAAYDTG